MAARSVTIKIQNDFDVALLTDHDSIQHGTWGTALPPRIEPGTTGQGVAESDGVMTGTEGTVWYRLDIPGSTGLVRFHWDNPYVGSNNYDQGGPAVVSVVRVGDGAGNDSTAHWVVADASTTGDGIPDAWKTAGATIDPGGGVGPQFVDLPAMGATVGKPDLFVHLDWMEDGTHSHRPSDAAIKLVVDAFAAAPYIARNGAVGINLHVDAGPSSIMSFGTGATWGGLSRAAAVGEVTQLGTGTVDADNGLVDYDWTEFDKLKNRTGGVVKSGRAPIFRYAVAAHQLASAGNSGVGRQPGSDFIVSLGTFAGVTDMQTAGTFMHELGHNLGLDHGGTDGVNNKPNYPSVMNYVWQFSGISRGGVFVLDYSRVALALLKEAALNETVGLGPGAIGYATAKWVPGVGGASGAFVNVANAAGPIDWDADGVADKPTVPFDVNGDGTQADLQPCNDWLNVRLRGGAIGAGGYTPPPMVTSVPRELTPADQARILPPDGTAPVTTASVWPMPNAAGWNRTAVTVTLTATDDISGVARTVYDVDGVGPTTYISPVPIGAEGVHPLGFSSIDHSQNAETRHETTVSLDLTAPEVVISYDPHADDVVVEGRDGLSGVVTSPVVPVSRSDVEWTPFGSDVAELRVYEVRDHADNVTTLYLKIRCSPFAYEASVLALRYDDDRRRGHAREEQPLAEVAEPRLEDRNSSRAPRNTMVFERLVGRSAAVPLLGVRQLVAIGEGDARRTVKARWDALDDYTILVRESGTGSCGPCRQGRERDEREQEERERERRRSGCCCDDEGDGDEGADEDGSDHGGSDSADAPCGPTVVSETDLRGLLVLHVMSEDGRLHVLE
ncbi:OmpL47-type beta-barrel domain-containing protein [Xylanimonas protaetiae]|uniref:Peptidase M11 gametolysin domain-containing protein n=1 Tax=Xylanimonas protaetiae TaxID=2509457 RepID=A0A4V0YFW2_9MICO|nr:M66 family metalloprotease [Xylanimonas protaetiae]QAY69101.1 hypothetical protein ET471_02780 [Xylanimonas protaetiae]